MEKAEIIDTDSTALPRAIQELFQGCKSPLVLLVNNKEETLNYLHNMGVNTSDWENGLMGLLYDVRVFPLKHAIPTLNLHSKVPQAGMIFKATQRRGTTTIAMEGTGHGPPVAAQATTITDTRQTHDRNHTKSRRTRGRNSRPYTLSTSDKRTRTLMESDNARTPVEIAVKLRLPDVETGWWCAGNEAPYVECTLFISFPLSFRAHAGF